MEILTPSDYESRARKRQRRSGRPCDVCRKRKTRCVLKDGEDHCVHCQLRGSSCTFEHDPQVRPQPPTSIPRRVDAGGSRVAASEGLELSGDVETRSGLATVSAHSTSDKHESPSAGLPSDFTSDTLALGLSQSRFAELYGIGSDMEPILMVGV
jgi:hypothetical protein